MKYTTKIKQAQLVGKIKIEPKGGELSEAEVKVITADPWGQELIKKGMLTIEGVKQETEQAKPAQTAAPATGTQGAAPAK